jgi:hypothetical protein
VAEDYPALSSSHNGQLILFSPRKTMQSDGLNLQKKASPGKGLVMG